MLPKNRSLTVAAPIRATTAPIRATTAPIRATTVREWFPPYTSRRGLFYERRRGAVFQFPARAHGHSFWVRHAAQSAGADQVGRRRQGFGGDGPRRARRRHPRSRCLLYTSPS